MESRKAAFECEDGSGSGRLYADDMGMDTIQAQKVCCNRIC